MCNIVYFNLILTITYLILFTSLCLHFSNLQARQTFALYLTYISALLKKCALEKNFDDPSSNLVLMFLIKASKNLSVPLKIEVSYLV